MNRLRIAFLLTLAADVLVTILAWTHLPDRVPVHWNIRGDVDRYGSRIDLLLLGPVLLIGFWGLCEALRFIDPKLAIPKPDDATEAEYRGAVPTVLSVVLVLFALLHALILLQALGLLREPARAHALLIAGFLLVFGNFVGRLRPSWFVGIRTPWTLSSDEVWRRTHRLAGRLMVPAGLLAIVLSLAVPGRVGMASAVVLLLASLIVPAALSYAFWRQERSV